MRSGEVIKSLPFVKLRLQIDVVVVRKQLIEFLLIRSMRALNFSVELRATRFDVSVSDALILDMPVELGLKLVAIVGAYLLNAERKLFDDVVNEVDSVRLRVTFVDFQCSHAGCIINCGVLVALVLSDNHHGRYRQPAWPVGLDGRRACPSGGQPHRPD